MGPFADIKSDVSTPCHAGPPRDSRPGPGRGGEIGLDKARIVCYTCSLDSDPRSAGGGVRMASENRSRNTGKQLETRALESFRGPRKVGQGKPEGGLKDCFLAPLSLYVVAR